MISPEVNFGSIPNFEFPVILNLTRFFEDILPKTHSKRPSGLPRPPTKIIGLIFKGDKTFLSAVHVRGKTPNPFLEESFVHKG